MLLPAIILAILVLQSFNMVYFVEEALSCSKNTISCSLRKLLLAFVCSRPWSKVRYSIWKHLDMLRRD
jgi:hypothetical protein